MENAAATAVAGKSIRICHPSDAAAVNLRGYIDTLATALKCSMDVQTTDGREMILRYVTSYVSKFKDVFMSKGKM